MLVVDPGDNCLAVGVILRDGDGHGLRRALWEAGSDQPDAGFLPLKVHKFGELSELGAFGVEVQSLVHVGTRGDVDHTVRLKDGAIDLRPGEKHIDCASVVDVDLGDEPGLLLHVSDHDLTTLSRGHAINGELDGGALLNNAVRRRELLDAHHNHVDRECGGGGGRGLLERARVLARPDGSGQRRDGNLHHELDVRGADQGDGFRRDGDAGDDQLHSGERGLGDDGGEGIIDGDLDLGASLPGKVAGGDGDRSVLPHEGEAGRLGLRERRLGDRDHLLGCASSGAHGEGNLALDELDVGKDNLVGTGGGNVDAQVRDKTIDADREGRGLVDERDRGHHVFDDERGLGEKLGRERGVLAVSDHCHRDIAIRVGHCGRDGHKHLEATAAVGLDHLGLAVGQHHGAVDNSGRVAHDEGEVGNGLEREAKVDTADDDVAAFDDPGRGVDHRRASRLDLDGGGGAASGLLCVRDADNHGAGGSGGVREGQHEGLRVEDERLGDLDGLRLRVANGCENVALGRDVRHEQAGHTNDEGGLEIDVEAGTREGATDNQSGRTGDEPQKEGRGREALAWGRHGDSLLAADVVRNGRGRGEAQDLPFELDLGGNTTSPGEVDTENRDLVRPDAELLEGDLDAGRLRDENQARRRRLGGGREREAVTAEGTDIVLKEAAVDQVGRESERHVLGAGGDSWDLGELEASRPEPGVPVGRALLGVALLLEVEPDGCVARRPRDHDRDQAQLPVGDGRSHELKRLAALLEAREGQGLGRHGAKLDGEVGSNQSGGQLSELRRDEDPPGCGTSERGHRDEAFRVVGEGRLDSAVRAQVEGQGRRRSRASSGSIDREKQQLVGIQAIPERTHGCAHVGGTAGAALNDGGDRTGLGVDIRDVDVQGSAGATVAGEHAQKGRARGQESELRVREHFAVAGGVELHADSLNGGDERVCLGYRENQDAQTTHGENGSDGHINFGTGGGGQLANHLLKRGVRVVAAVAQGREAKSPDVEHVRLVGEALGSALEEKASRGD
mmetsp:Transcript_21141/g.49539  ORF Transcript_21141/g.49539 Transcript_21141/m.49539 type:complete len:1017 (-) Transcript_21141:6771-9821(-)